ncbi:MAG: hypothetical protein H0U00_14450 [Actinobacteria bacterium]|nr:hypothetical protein [Actinomycetota bacterium]
MTLEHLRGFPGGVKWLERLPRLVEECREQWSLRLVRLRGRIRLARIEG